MEDRINKGEPSLPTAARFYLNILLFMGQIMERVMGIEPTHLAWKASVLPLNYTRIDSTWSG
jgi:hypothetical protein